MTLCSLQVYIKVIQILSHVRLVLDIRASLGAQTVKNLPAMQETWIQSLGWEDPSEKGMATHARILA